MSLLTRLRTAMGGDLYAKGWVSGRQEALKELRADLTRRLPSLTVVRTVEIEYVEVGDVLRVIDEAIQSHPERNPR